MLEDLPKIAFEIELGHRCSVEGSGPLQNHINERLQHDRAPHEARQRKPDKGSPTKEARQRKPDKGNPTLPKHETRHYP